MDERMILLIIAGMVVIACTGCAIAAVNRFTLKSFSLGFEAGKKEGYQQGRTNSWTHVGVDWVNQKIYFNGRPLPEPPMPVKGRTVWWIDGHLRDEAMITEPEPERAILRFYARDLNRMQERLSDD